ncbi:GTPase Der [Calothrix sp. NIES-4071]|nr:GTPase Der [Calothrix sp. NIES-4071]BAZ54967.1 GTPase Der [Calothrix sp. NIES-4105]
MLETIHSLLDKINDIAVELQEPTTTKLVTAVREQLNTSKLRILVVGSTGSGRSSLSNVLLEQPILPVSPIPKAPISINIQYGGTDAVELATTNGLNQPIPQKELWSIVTRSNTDFTKYSSIKVETNCELLKTSEIRIESIAARRSITEWKELLAKTDYIILVLKATALLSEQEKQFIKNILVSNFGLERVAIVINQMDLVPEDEHVSIVELVRSFLGSYESQPVLIESSAVLADYGYEALMSLVKVSLLEKHNSLKSAALCQAMEICLTELTEGIIRQNALLALNEAQCKDLMNQIDSRNQWLQTRVEKSQNRVELFMSTLIKEEFFREIEGFSNALREQLPKEIMSVEDITTIRRYLPSYLDTIWAEFFYSQQSFISSKLSSEMVEISKLVEEELRDLFGDNIVKVEDLLTSFDPTPANRKAVLMQKKTSNQMGTIATGIQFAGFLLLIPALPLGVFTIGAGQIVRVAYKKEMQISEKQSIVSSTLSTTRELECQIKKQVEAQFVTLTEELKQRISELYDQALTEIYATLKNGVNMHKELGTKKEQLDKFNTVTIPELSKQLKQICCQDAI